MQLTIGREEVLLFVAKGNKMDTIICGNGRLFAGQGMQPGLLCFVARDTKIVRNWCDFGTFDVILQGVCVCVGGLLEWIGDYHGIKCLCGRKFFENFENLVCDCFCRKVRSRFYVFQFGVWIIFVLLITFHCSMWMYEYTCERVLQCICMADHQALLGSLLTVF